MKKITRKHLFERQTTLPEIGEDGQERISEAEVLIIGCGGLGGVAAVYLAASGIGRIHLIDYDVVEVSNLHRQVFFKPEDVGKPKARVLARYLQSIAPFTEVTFSNTVLNKQNAIDIIDEFPIVLDCTDSLPTKYLINDVCVITDTILVYGSLYKYDGYVATFNMTKGGKRTANLRDAFPEMSAQHVPNCAEAGTLNGIAGIIGIMQANEVIKIVTHTGQPLMNQILIYNSNENTQFKMKLSSEPCYKKAEKGCILKSFKKENYDDPACEIQEETYQITPEELHPESFKIIALHENQVKGLPFKVWKHIPYSDFIPDLINWEKEQKYLFICKKGITSYAAVKWIREDYPGIDVYNLKYGTDNLNE